MTSAPRWKLCCNNCTLVNSFDDAVHGVELEKVAGDVEDAKGKPAFSECEDCQEVGKVSRLIKITFGKKSELECLEETCVLCDDLEGVLQSRLARFGEHLRRGRGGRRGRGRGRRKGGRGGRGRGRGRQ